MRISTSNQSHHMPLGKQVPGALVLFYFSAFDVGCVHADETAVAVLDARRHRICGAVATQQLRNDRLRSERYEPCNHMLAFFCHIWHAGCVEDWRCVCDLGVWCPTTVVVPSFQPRIWSLICPERWWTWW